MTWLEISNLLLWVIVLIQLFFMFLLVRLVGSFLNRFRLAGKKVEERKLNIGENAPVFRARDHKGELIRLYDGSDNNTLLIFTSKSCPSCKTIISQLSSLDKFTNEMEIIVISDKEYSKEDIVSTNGIHFISSIDIIKNYFVEKVPHMFLINERGMIMHSDSIRSIEHLSLILDTYLKKVS